VPYVTVFGIEEHRIATREAGFDAHMVKPVDSHVLENMLHTLFRKCDGLPSLLVKMQRQAAAAPEGLEATAKKPGPRAKEIRAKSGAQGGGAPATTLLV
jgi:DNA-binding response OmpR family regulator